MEDVFRSKDEKIRKLSNILTKYADGAELSFVFEGHELKNNDVFGHYGTLPLFLVEAQETYEKYANGLFTTPELLSTITEPNSKIKMKDADIKKDQEWINKREIEFKFPITYHFQEENTFFSFIPRVSEEIPCDFYLLAHYAHYTLEEYVKRCQLNNVIKNGRIPLDELYNKMIEKINDRKLNIIERPYTAPAKHMVNE